MSIFSLSAYTRIAKYMYIWYGLGIIVCINIIYYIYWIYYISYIFQQQNNEITSLNYYNEHSYHIYNSIATMEFNLSLFELQTAMIWIILWTVICLFPYIISIYLTQSRNYLHFKLVDSIYVVNIIVINLLIQLIYIPVFISIMVDYYAIYQITNESFHLNIEYNILALIKNIIYIHILTNLVYILSHLEISRAFILIIYIFIVHLNSPLILILIGLLINMIITEFVTFNIIMFKNHLKKIAGHCTGTEK